MQGCGCGPSRGSQGPPAQQPASPELGAPWGPPERHTDSGLSKRQQPAWASSPDLTSTSLQIVPERPCPGHPPHSASALGKSSPRAPPLYAGLCSSLSLGGRRAGTQAGWAGREQTRPRGQPAPAKHPRPPRALRHQALPLHTCTHTEAHVCAPTHRHTRTRRHTPSLKWLIIAVKTPHPTPAGSGPHAAARACRPHPKQIQPRVCPCSAQNSTPKRPQGPSSGSGAGMTHSSGFGETRKQRRHGTRQGGPGPPSSSPDADSPQLHPHFQHAPDVRTRPGGPENLQALARHGKEPPPPGTVSEKGPPEQDGGPGTTWPPRPSPSSVRPQPRPGPAGGGQPDTDGGTRGHHHGPAWARPPGWPDTRPHPPWPPALGTSCLKSLYPGKACQPRARTLGHTAVLEPQPLQVPGPGWAHRASASGPSNNDVLRLHLPLLLPGSRTPEHGARPRAGLPAQGGPGAGRARRGPGLPNTEKLPRHTPRQERGGDASQR